MNEEGLGVADVSQVGEDVRIVNEFTGSCIAVFQFKGENRTGSLGEVFLSQFVVRRRRKGRIVDLSDFRMIFKEVCNLLSVSDVAFDAKGQGFEALDEEPCIERADASTEVAEGFGADTSYEASTGDILGEVNAVVGFVRRSKFFEAAGTSPVEFAVFNDEAAQGRAVAADEFRSRMDDDVSTVFERTEEKRRSEGVVNDDRKAVLVGDFSDGFEVRNVDSRVAEAFQVNGFRLVVDVFGKGLRVIGIGEVRRNAEVFECFTEQFDCAAVQRRPAVPPSRAAIRFSRTSCVGLVKRL